MPGRGGSSIRRARLGRELRRLRESAGLLGDDVAARLKCSAAKVSRIENARTLPSMRDVEDLLEVYGADRATCDRLIELAGSAAAKGWWYGLRKSLTAGTPALLDLESEAVEMRTWEPQLVPGLLQTQGYADALFRSLQPITQVPAETWRDRAEVRMRRKKTLLLASSPVRFLAVLEESVLTRQFGDATVMREQLLHLEEMSELPHVEMRILPQDAPPPVPMGAFLLLGLPDFPDVVYLEEFCGARFVEDAEQVFAYERAFDHLLGLALDEDDSRRLVREVMAARWS